jgi:hypothetical protein
VIEVSGETGLPMAPKLSFLKGLANDRVFTRKKKARKRFRSRAGIKHIIGHLRSDYRLMRNYLKGNLGDSINLLLAAAAFNFKKLMRQLHDYFLLFFLECREITPRLDVLTYVDIQRLGFFQGLLNTLMNNPRSP